MGDSLYKEIPIRGGAPTWFKNGVHNWRSAALNKWNQKYNNRPKPGRPPIPKEERRRLRNVLWNNDEWAEVRRLAKESGMNLSHYVRAKALGEEWVEAHKTAKKDKILYEKKRKIKVRSVSQPRGPAYVERESIVSLCGSLPSEQL